MGPPLALALHPDRIPGLLLLVLVLLGLGLTDTPVSAQQVTFSVVGHDVSGTRMEGQLRQIADAGAGEYVSADDGEELVVALRQAAGVTAGAGGGLYHRQSPRPLPLLVFGSLLILVVVLFTLGLMRGRSLVLRDRAGEGHSGRSERIGVEIYDAGRGTHTLVQWAVDRAGSLRIGRGSGNHIVLHDPEVSLAHLELTRHDGEVWARDLGSRNGVWLDQRRWEGGILPDGSRLELGRRSWVSITARHPEESAVGQSRSAARQPAWTSRVGT